MKAMPIRTTLCHLGERLSGGFSGRALTVMTGTVIGQGLALVTLPVIAQLYSADVLGRAATSLALLNILSILVCFQYDQAVVVADGNDLPYLLSLATGAAISWILVLGIIVGFSRALWIDAYQWLLKSGMDPILLLLISGYAPFLLLTNLRLRRNQLHRVSLGRITYYGGGSLLQIAGGLIFGGNERTYLLAQMVATFLAVAGLFPYRDTIRWLKLHRPSIFEFLVGIRRAMRTYQNFPKYQTGAALLNSLSIQLPVVIMRVAFSDAWAGWYFMAWRLLAAPTTLLAQAVGQVFYRDSAERERKGTQQEDTLERVVVGLIQISLLPAIVLGCVIPLLVQVFLGTEWSPVATILQILLISFVVTFFTSPISTLLNVRNLQGPALGFNALLFVGRALAMLVGWLLGSPLGAVWGYSLVSLAVLLPFFRFVVHSAGGSVMRIFRRATPLLRDSGLLLVFVAILWQLKWLDDLYGISLLLMLAGLAGWREYRRTTRRAKEVMLRSVK